MPKIYTVRELKKRLKKHDKRFKFEKSRGKGSEQLIFHPDINGKPQQYPIKAHGEGDSVLNGYYPSIRRRFDLPDDFFN